MCHATAIQQGNPFDLVSDKVGAAAAEHSLTMKRQVQRQRICGSSTTRLCHVYFRPRVSETKSSRADLLRPCVKTAQSVHGAEEANICGNSEIVEIKDVRPGQTVSVKGKVMSKSGTMTLAMCFRIA